MKQIHLGGWRGGWTIYNISRGSLEILQTQIHFCVMWWVMWVGNRYPEGVDKDREGGCVANLLGGAIASTNTNTIEKSNTNADVNTYQARSRYMYVYSRSRNR